MSRRGGDPRGGGTSAWLTAVRERTFGNVTEKLLMMTLCDYINGDDECWPGNTTLAPDVGVDPRTIRRTLARLEEAGVISRYRRPRTDGKGRATDAIVFLWEGFQALPLVDQGDILSGDQGDIPNVPRGQSDPLPRGHSGTPSSFRTPQLEPPKNPGVKLIRREGDERSDSELLTAAFDAFWEKYPRKTAKPAALKAWPVAVKLAGGDLRRIVKGVRRYADDANLPEKQFIPYPSKWLREGRWDDEPLPERNGNRPPQAEGQFQTMSDQWQTA